MLGCQDFCGYYDWTFSHVRRLHGHDAVAALWRDAIGGESQQHYTEAGQRAGLKGLLQVWTATGVDEKCDWTFTLDEGRNTLRWDMRQCPSKGFLINNDLVNDEDYCDHCVGWIAPLLRKVGVEVTGHEHNHAGQCWLEMSVADKPSETLDLPIDIRHDSRWGTGYIDRFRNGVKLPLQQYHSPDPCDVLAEWFRRYSRFKVLGRGPSARAAGSACDDQAVLVTDPTYATRDVFAGDPAGVLIGDAPRHLEQVAERFHATESSKRPLLMHAYMPAMPPVNFAEYDLPRPVPILPLLIRHQLYRHEPRKPYPTSGVFLVMVACALNKPVSIAGVDLFTHPSGYVYAGDSEPAQHVWPSRHDPEVDLKHFIGALQHNQHEVQLPDVTYHLINIRPMGR